jgi:uncharacterized small protein (DUF1192 family)
MRTLTRRGASRRVEHVVTVDGLAELSVRELVQLVRMLQAENERLLAQNNERSPDSSTVDRDRGKTSARKCP